ncbi:ABC transporter substrate-binding protein [Niallia sp. FSL W8-0635]|uniref:ABC transporter substrate-binding protein n=1 Tax=Niallia sp. FSL W8-0635 TaxID=2975337 RepID=UPI002B040E41|nr:carbohydrate ABC transporter substrate-binding protein [Yersinia enterocolitica]
MKKSFTWILLVMSALLVFTGCSNQSSSSGKSSGADGDKIELRFTWWGGQERSQKTQEVIKLYEKLHPDVKIVPEFSGLEGYFEKLDTQLASGNAPDIIQFGGNLNDYVLKGVVLPLDEYIGKELDLSKHPENMIRAATYDDKFYGVVLGVNAGGLVMNKTAFDEANVPIPADDWTWEDLEKTSKEITTALDKKYGVLDFDEDGFGMFLAQRDKVAYDNGKVGFEEQDAKEWFQLWQDMRESGAAAPAELQTQNQDDPAQSLIVRGDVAMQFIFSNQYAAYNSATKDELTFHIPPYDGETGKNGVTLLPSQFLAGNAKTEHPKEVAEFLDFFVNNIDAGEVLGMDRGIPVNSEVREKVSSSATDEDKVVLDYIDLVTKTSDAEYTPLYPGYVEEQKLYKQTVETIAFEKDSVDNASERYFKELNKIIERHSR